MNTINEKEVLIQIQNNHIDILEEKIKVQDERIKYLENILEDILININKGLNK